METQAKLTLLFENTVTGENAGQPGILKNCKEQNNLNLNASVKEDLQLCE